MAFDKAAMLAIVRKQLAIDMNCSAEDFDRDGIVFCEAAFNPGRRLFDRQSPFLEIATMGRSTVVSADKEIMPGVKQALENILRHSLVKHRLTIRRPQQRPHARLDVLVSQHTWHAASPITPNPTARSRRLLIKFYY